MTGHGRRGARAGPALWWERWRQILGHGAAAVLGSGWLALVVHASGNRGAVLPFALAFLAAGGAVVPALMALSARRQLPGRGHHELTTERALALGDRIALLGFIARVLTLAALGFLVAAIIAVSFPGRRLAAAIMAAIMAPAGLAVLGILGRGGATGWVVDLLISDAVARQDALGRSEPQRYHWGWSRAGRLDGLRTALAQDGQAPADARAILWARYAPAAATVTLDIRVKGLHDELHARRAGWRTAASVAVTAAVLVLLLLAVLPRGILGAVPPLDGLHFWPPDEAEPPPQDGPKAGDETPPDDGNTDRDESDVSSGAESDQSDGGSTGGTGDAPADEGEAGDGGGSSGSGQGDADFGDGASGSNRGSAPEQPGDGAGGGDDDEGNGGAAGTGSDPGSSANHSPAGADGDQGNTGNAGSGGSDGPEGAGDDGTAEAAGVPEPASNVGGQGDTEAGEAAAPALTGPGPADGPSGVPGAGDTAEMTDPASVSPAPLDDLRAGADLSAGIEPGDDPATLAPEEAGSGDDGLPEPATTPTAMPADGSSETGDWALVAAGDMPDDTESEEVEIGTAVTLFAAEGMVPDTVERALVPGGPDIPPPAGRSSPPRQPVPAWIEALLP